MATTAQQVFDITMDLIDERLDNGTISLSDTLDYNVKTPGILNILQSELIKQGDLYSTHPISNKPIANMLGDRSGFNIEAYEGEEITYECTGSVKAFYFEVDNDATIYIEDYTDTWNTLETITATPTASGFTAQSGLVTPTSGATRSRIRLGGDYYYRIVNRALFSVPLASEEDIPVYRPWVLKQMPADFKSVNEIVNEEGINYTQNAGYKWEGKRDLYMDYYYDGSIRIVYHPVPTLITALTDTLQLDDVTARKVLPYGLATHLMLNENPEQAQYFNGRFEEMKADANKKPPAPTEQITNLYGGF
jgi:hypothetical protein